MSGQKSLLTSFQRNLLQDKLQENLPRFYRQRIEIMLLADEGKSQTQICQTLKCSHGTARYWISMARANQAHHWNQNSIGRPRAVDHRYLERLQELVRHSPREFGYPFRRWTAQWLSKHLSKELDVTVSDRHINRLLKQLGLSTRTQSTRPEKVVELSNPDQSVVMIHELPVTSGSESTVLWTFNPIG